MHFSQFQSIWSILVHSGLFSPFGQLRSIQYTLVPFGPLWSIQFIHFGSFAPFQSIWSISMYFAPLQSIWSNLVHFNPYNPLWCISVHMVNYSVFWSTLVYWLHTIHFGAFQSNWSILVPFSPYGLQSIRSISIYLDDALGGEVYVKRGAALLTVMSHSQHNDSMFFIKLQVCVA